MISTINILQYKESEVMEMRRKEKMISQEEVMEVLETAEYGVLSTVSGDGIPYGTPVNFVFMDGAIYFHCATVRPPLPAGRAMVSASHHGPPEKHNTSSTHIVLDYNRYRC